jgi:hypothetical protein
MATRPDRILKTREAVLTGETDPFADGAETLRVNLLPDFLREIAIDEELSARVGPLSGGVRASFDVALGLDFTADLIGGGLTATTPWDVSFAFPTPAVLAENPNFRLIGDALIRPEQARFDSLFPISS